MSLDAIRGFESAARHLSFTAAAEELAGRLARLHPETKVLCVSGYAGEALGGSAMIEPGTALLAKPFTPEAIARAGRQALNGGG